MSLYHLAVVIHVLAALLWLGHMFVWSLIVGPAMKRIEPAHISGMLRERSLFLGGLGWPALLVLIPTGLYLLSLRGVGLADLFSGAAFAGPQGAALAWKLPLVLFMVAYQAVFGHRPGGLAIYLNMLAAAVILWASVALARGGFF